MTKLSFDELAGEAAGDLIGGVMNNAGGC